MTAAEVLGLLTPEERARRAELEEQVLVGIRAGALSARAARTLRDERLYRSTHTTFESYAKEVFGLSRQRVYQLIDFAGVAEEASAYGIEVSNERMARALGVVEPQNYQLVMSVTKAVTGKERPSSADVQGVADVVRNMAEGMQVEHPDTQQPVPLAQVPPERRAEAVTKAVQRGSKDRRDFQGIDDIKPWDWLDGLRLSGSDVQVLGTAEGWQVVVTDRSTGEQKEGPQRKGQWDAIKAARAVLEGGDERI